MVREYAPKGYIGMLHVADRVWIEAPTYTETFGRDERLAKALLDTMKANPGQSTKAVKAAVAGNEKSKRDALEALLVDGRARSEDGPHNAKLWYVVEF
jgi:hypothetical protein